jgi:hypothetical protein
MSATIQLRRGTAANLASANPTLHAGEPAIETDTGKTKLGDGSTAWNSLPYKPAEEGVVALVDGATIAVNAAKGHKFSVQITDSRTLGNPTNPQGDGQILIFLIQQAAGGGKTLTFDTKYKGSADIPLPVLTTSASATDCFAFIYRLSLDQWWLIASVQGF